MTLLENEYLREDSEFNQTVLRSIEIHGNCDYTVGIAMYALNSEYYNMLSVAFDELDVPKDNLTLEERIAYIKLFVRGNG